MGGHCRLCWRRVAPGKVRRHWELFHDFYKWAPFYHHVDPYTLRRHWGPVSGSAVGTLAHSRTLPRRCVWSEGGKSRRGPMGGQGPVLRSYPCAARAPRAINLCALLICGLMGTGEAACSSKNYDVMLHTVTSTTMPCTAGMALHML